MNAFPLIRKTKDEKEIAGSIPSHQSYTKRVLEFGANDRVNPHLTCTIEVDEETFGNMKVGAYYQISIEPVPSV